LHIYADLGLFFVYYLLSLACIFVCEVLSDCETNNRIHFMALNAGQLECTVPVIDYCDMNSVNPF